MNFEAAEKMIAGVDKGKAPGYELYFDSIRPKDQTEVFRRAIFAVASVHTTWESNVNLYAALWDLKWINDVDLLKQRITESRAGLINMRTKAYMQLTAMMNQYPELFRKQPNESWYEFRDRISDNVFGLGQAKAAFFIELVYFHDSRIACFDTHALQTYEIKPPDIKNVTPTQLARMEVHWDESCRRHGVNPVTARWLLWDGKQNKPDSRYWSHVLEGQPVLAGDPQLELFTGTNKDA